MTPHCPRRWIPTTTVAVIVAATSPRSATAEPTPAERAAQAESHIAKARRLRAQRDWAAAAAELRHAIELAPRPSLHRDLGDCHEQLGEPEDAIRHYRLYVEGLPAAADRAEIDRRIKSLATPRLRVAPRTRPAAPPASLLDDMALALDGAPRSIAPPALAPPPGPPASTAPPPPTVVPIPPASLPLATPAPTRPPLTSSGASPDAPDATPPNTPTTTRRWWLFGALGAAVLGGAIAFFAATRPPPGTPASDFGTYRGLP